MPKGAAGLSVQVVGINCCLVCVVLICVRIRAVVVCGTVESLSNGSAKCVKKQELQFKEAGKVKSKWQ